MVLIKNLRSLAVPRRGFFSRGSSIIQLYLYKASHEITENFTARFLRRRIIVNIIYFILIFTY